MFSQTMTEVRLRRTQRLSVTALEQRCVPSTTATFVRGNLAIIGDDGNQNITITEKGAGTYRVAGLSAGSQTYSGVNYIAVNTMGGTDNVTLVGGPYTIPNGVTVTGAGALTVVNDKFNVNALNGRFSVLDTGTNDVSVFIQAGTFLGKAFNVTTGAGNDAVVVGPGAEVYGPVLLNLGGGTNSTNFTGAVVEGALTVAGGAGSDTVVLTNTKLGVFKPGSLDLNLGGGNDIVKLSGLTVNGNGQVVSTSGSLKLDVTNAMFQGYLDIGARQVTTQVSTSTLGGWLRVTTDPTNNTFGVDAITIDSCQIGGDFNVQTGTNYQYLNVKATIVAGNGSVSGKGSALFIATGFTVEGGLVVDYHAAPANDSADIRLTQTTVKRALAITTGAGNDTIILAGAIIGQTSPSAVTMINTGGGNDTVDLSSSTVYCNARFDGGPGTDTLHMGGARFLGLPPVIVNFETVG